MKKYLSIILAGLSFSAVQSQEISDALRYAQDNLNGTARFRAMSGAFGALGGDLSSINVNPAGSAIFTTNQFGATLSNYNTKNNSNYFGTKTSENNTIFDLNQAGAVFVFKNYDTDSDWKKFNIAVNYENANNFDNALFSAGTNPTNSIDKYFLYYANTNGGVSLSNLQLQSNESISDLYGYLGSNFGYGEQQAFIGYQAYVLDADANYDENTNRNYVSLVPGGGNYYQENSFESTGYNGKLTFNAAAEYKDFLYVGLNLNSHFTDYSQSTSFYEENNNNASTDNLVNRLRFNNDILTYGTGFSFQLGAIAKVTKELRFGLSYESPTWYRLNDELQQSLVAVSSSSAGELAPDVVNPQITMVYDAYKIQTPSKVTGSFAYVFGKEGLISFDLGLKDYSATRFKPKSDFREINSTMNSILDNTIEYRIGAEKRIKQWSLRAGYRMEQSPYKNSNIMSDLTGYSAGFGYNFGSTKLDLSYSHAERDYQQQFFSQGLTDSATINSVNNNVSLTLLFEL
jgi:hypothetical protein